jgi:hypothetical protein
MLINPDGVLLEDDAAARSYAMRLVRDMRKESPVTYMGQVLIGREGERVACCIAFALARQSRLSPTHPRRL